ncbi:unnamed protein product [Mycoplasma amphoriforme A39]|uniref:Uncharacterized protein n=1 Tax=Mycoplasma amphoriforme A39 TaxID=572419 RepID=A0A292IIY5_9MOLU|nr:unnamed protein product [Mycoplasma amphoriforme A39]
MASNNNLSLSVLILNLELFYKIKNSKRAKQFTINYPCFQPLKIRKYKFVTILYKYQKELISITKKDNDSKFQKLIID